MKTAIRPFIKDLRQTFTNQLHLVTNTTQLRKIYKLNKSFFTKLDELKVRFFNGGALFSCPVFLTGLAFFEQKKTFRIIYCKIISRYILFLIKAIFNSSDKMEKVQRSVTFAAPSREKTSVSTVMDIGPDSRQGEIRRKTSRPQTTGKFQLFKSLFALQKRKEKARNRSVRNMIKLLYSLFTLSQPH